MALDELRSGMIRDLGWSRRHINKQVIVADMVRLQRLTGMRPGEVCSLWPCDVNSSDDIWLYVPDEHKTEHHEKDRVIVLGPRAQKLLKGSLNRDAENFCFSLAESEQLRSAAAERQAPLRYGNSSGTNRVRNPRRQAGDRYTTDSELLHCLYRPRDEQRRIG